MSGLHATLLALHVGCALLGFGSVAITGIYGFSAVTVPDGGPREETIRYFLSPGRLEWLVLAVPFLGAGALAAEPHGRGVTQLWSSLAALVWLAAAVLLLAIVRPGERAVREALAVGDERVVAKAGRRIGWGAMVTDVAFLVALGLMIWQPH